MKQLENKVAIVTGAASGIGKATALLLAEEGARTVVSDIDKKKGQKVVDEIKMSGGEASFIKADASKAEDNENLVKQTLDAYGKLHIAVNNAGIGGPLSLTADYSVNDWQKVINLNLNGVFYGMKYQIDAIQKAGGGSIVNIASILGQAGTRQSPAYVAAKHGVVGLTKAAALEYAQENIRINSVGPGYINTPLVQNSLDDETIDTLKGMHPVGRLGEPEEVAELILWLASDKSSFVTGSYYPVDGGYLAQ
ncbi:SDR family NAD(P)-dependent oxidoreductase [Halalkalibaculum sp. DA3122]|uniref:SDR family NAD(P)-dependent oxidoreductase n=1 Tax=Halalkalibaculum sp. DA3122 TaxID=3373607 RepID=UPI0037548028